MIAFLTLCYVAILGVLVWLKVLPNTIATWLSTLAWVLLLLPSRIDLLERIKKLGCHIMR